MTEHEIHNRAQQANGNGLLERLYFSHNVFLELVFIFKKMGNECNPNKN